MKAVSKKIINRPCARMTVCSLLLLAGCSRWENVKHDTPWLAPNRQAVEQQKAHFDWNAGTVHEVRLLGADNRIYDLKQIISATDEFLFSTRYGSNILATRNHKSPPWNTIVSISPTIVLSVPSSLTLAQKGYLLGTNHPVRSFYVPKSAGYDYGSIVLFNEGMHWFSPDLKQEPTLVIFSTNGTAEIKLPDGKLELTIQREVCRIRRR